MKDLAFEFYHFRVFRDLIKNPRLLSYPRAVRQAIACALLIHFRLLVQFFFYKRRPNKEDNYQDDLFAQDFGQLPELSEFLKRVEERPPWMKDVLAHLGKRLAHLTTTRGKQPAPDMDYYAPYLDEVDSLTHGFEAVLPDEFKNLLRGYLCENEGS